jgi:hypothetical protein
VSLRQELEYFIEKQDELVEKYNGRYVVLKNQQVIGDYDDIGDAYVETKKMHEPGTFAIYECISGPSAYSMTISTPGLFRSE